MLTIVFEASLFTFGAAVGAVFHAWIAKRAAEAKATFDKAVADAVAKAIGTPKA